MFAAPTRASFVFSVLLLCGSALMQAQIHEEKPTPGLDKGVLLHLEKQADRSKVDAAGKTIGAGDFSVVCRIVLPAELPALAAPVGILTGSDEVASHDRKTGWKLLLGPDRSLSFTAQTKEGGASVKIDTLKDAVKSGGVHDLVVSVHRDPRQPLSGIWVDGIELASGTFSPMDLRASFPGGDWDMSGWVKSVTVYDRALTRPEIVELNLRGTDAISHLPKPAHPALPANGPRFVPQEGETVVLIGGTEAVALAESGHLEAILTAEFSQTRFHFRNLAWEGDTVFKQDRPLNYGDLSQQLQRVNAGAVFVMFGRQECLERGKEGLADFRAALEKMIAMLRKQTPNIVICAPAPFEKKEPPLPDLSGRNDDLKAYASVMSEVADWNHLTFCNPADSFFKRLKGAVETSDGIGLTPAGCLTLAVNLADELKYHAGEMVNSGTVVKPGGLVLLTDPLLPAIHAKNRLWHDYWRPSNWAFLYGDRTNQPSSRDPVNSQIRLFPAEQETILPMIKAAEEKIYRVTEDMQKRLP